MTILHTFLAATLSCIALCAGSAHATQDTPEAVAAGNLAHVHDFDFLVGDWKVHHRRLKERLAGSTEWQEFAGTSTMHMAMDGRATFDDNLLELPAGTYRAIGVRAYDPKTGDWAIWWLDGRNPHGPLDPPVKGRFENGVGTFYANDTLRGKTVRVRYTWSQITPTSAHWQQAYSPDGGKTWEVNWDMDFLRVK